MKIVHAIAAVIFVLCLPLLLVSTNLRFIINSAGFYAREFDRYHISQDTGLPREELGKVARGMIAYFNNRDEFIHLTVQGPQGPFELFKEKEIEHLKDVKGLVRLDYKVQGVTLACVLAYLAFVLNWKRRQAWRYIGRSALAGSALTVVLLLALGITSAVDFNAVFLLFHLISFSNLLWILDPSTDYMIRIFTWQFFYDALLLLAGATLLEGLLIGGISWWRLKGTKKPRHVGAKKRAS